MVLRVGTRASELATTQTGHVAERLSEIHGIEIEIVPISTTGDRSTRPLAELARSGTGVFVAALREALAEGVVDVAVHSLKDLPTPPDPRLTLAATPLRVDPRDCLVARDGLTLGELPHGSRIGTGSPRRVSQLAALGRDFEMVDIRGNVGSRLARVGADLDAIVLARAGLLRLGRAEVATEVIDPLTMLSAPGQGALACECRADDSATIRLLAAIDDPDTRAAVTAERSLLNTLEAGCSAPVGALADVALGDHGDELWLRAVVGDVSGAPSIRRSATGTPERAHELGDQLARDMLDEGADTIMASVTTEGAS